MTTTDGATIPDAELLAAVDRPRAAALRDLVETSVTTTVAARRAARRRRRGPRRSTARLAAARRPVSQLPALDDPGAFRRVYNPVTGVGSAARAAAGRPPGRRRRRRPRRPSGWPTRGRPSYVHGGMSALLMDQLLGAAADRGRAVGHDRAPGAGLPRPAAAGDRRCCCAPGSPRTPAASRSSPARSRSPPRPSGSLVEARGVFVAPRPERSEAYFGSITDASGRHRPPGRPTDATAVARRRREPARARRHRPGRRRIDGYWPQPRPPHGGHWSGNPHRPSVRSSVPAVDPPGAHARDHP